MPIPKTNWEKEFDKIMEHLNWESCNCCGRYREHLKPAIRHLLSSQQEVKKGNTWRKGYQMGYNEAQEKIKAQILAGLPKKKRIDVSNPNSFMNTLRSTSFKEEINGYNQCLKEITNLIKKI